ncbi:MAG TPA: hypothetical protein VHN79_03590 [Lacunisphaera sp.]|nr:hypothetical protein [Lacunisphaera sp.]
MKRNAVLLLIGLLAIGAPLSAGSVALTRAQASELYMALASAEAGFAPANTVAAADNLNALRPHVEALDKGKQAFQRAVRRLATAPDAEARAEQLVIELEAKADEVITLDLTPLALSDDELTASKLKPATLAVIRRWLAAPKK